MFWIQKKGPAKKRQLQICILLFYSSSFFCLSSHPGWHLPDHGGLSVVHFPKHSPFRGADSQDHGRMSVEHISKLSRWKIVHTCWAPWSVPEKKLGALGTSTALTLVPSPANHSSCHRRRFQTGQTPEKLACVSSSLIRGTQQQRWRNDKKNSFVCHCLGASDSWSGRGNTSLGRTHGTTDKNSCGLTLKSIFAPAFPCLTGLLRAPLWEELAMVLLVSQSWLDAVVVLIAFLLSIVHADPVTTWLDAVVVLIAFLLSVVLVDRFVNLLPARWPLWRSKADLPLDMLCSWSALALSSW